YLHPFVELAERPAHSVRDAHLVTIYFLEPLQDRLEAPRPPAHRVREVDDLNPRVGCHEFPRATIARVGLEGDGRRGGEGIKSWRSRGGLAPTALPSPSDGGPLASWRKGLFRSRTIAPSDAETKVSAYARQESGRCLPRDRRAGSVPLAGGRGLPGDSSLDRVSEPAHVLLPQGHPRKAEDP